MTDKDVQTPECGATLAEYVAIEHQLRRAVCVAYAASDVFPERFGAEHLALEATERYRAVEAQAVQRWGLPSIRQAIIESHEREALSSSGGQS